MAGKFFKPVVNIYINLSFQPWTLQQGNTVPFYYYFFTPKIYFILQI